MKKMKLRWGVIGAGGIADRRTIPGMMEAENAELVAVMEVEQSLADSIKEKYGAKAAYDNADDLLARDDIDAVYIASPVICHEEAAVKAAEAGKHILIEKPIALTSAKAQEIIDYCDKKGIKVGAGFMMRFAAYHQLLKRLLDGMLGNRVERARGLVQDQDLGVFQDDARERKALFFASRQLQAAVTDLGIVALGLGDDIVVDVGDLARLLELGFGRVLARV